MFSSRKPMSTGEMLDQLRKLHGVNQDYANILNSALSCETGHRLTGKRSLNEQPLPSNTASLIESTIYDEDGDVIMQDAPAIIPPADKPNEPLIDTWLREYNNLDEDDDVIMRDTPSAGR